MSKIFETIQRLVEEGEIRVSEHGYDELSADGMLAREVVEGIGEAILVEDYPDYPKGPCILLLQEDSQGQPLHVVWGIPKGHIGPAVLVTAYRPDPQRWEEGFLRRRP